MKAKQSDVKKSYIEYDNNGFLVGFFDGKNYQEIDQVPAHINQLTAAKWKNIQICCDKNYHGTVPDGVERF